MNTKTNNVYIQNFWYVNNYGACLTAYALYTVIANMGHNSQLIDISKLGEHLSYQFRNFIDKHCKTTKWIKSYSDLKQIIDVNSIYITGSDQVFRPYLVKNNLNKFLFDYVGNAKKIAFSASFGKNKEDFVKETSRELLEKMQKSLNSFDYISTREKDGVEICKDVFGVDAQTVIDPVFILDKSYFEKFTNEGKTKYNNYIATCIFEKKNNQLDKFLAEKYSCKVFELHESNLSIEDWLCTIQNCRFLVTNSFHAMCFAIIFNKPFIALSKDMGASSRFESLFEMLGIANQSISSVDEIYESDCIFNINWERVNKQIEEEREKGLDFLKEVLEAPVSKFEEKQAVITKYLEDKVCDLEQQTNLKYQLKKSLWNLWLIIFYKYLPEPMKNIIRKIRGSK